MFSWFHSCHLIDAWGFIIWALPTIVMGFLPMIIATFILHLNSDPTHPPEMYLDGGLLFLGPALLGALWGELRNEKLLFNDEILSGITVLVIVSIVLVSIVVYTNIRTRKSTEKPEALLVNDERFVSFVRELSWGMTFASIMYVLSVTAVAIHRHNLVTAFQ